jgi:exodeoxyribonuclease V alpha subunit
MSPVVDLSPFGTARADIEGTRAAGDDEAALLGWLGGVRERLVSTFAVEDEVAFLAWEVARWPSGLTVEDRAALALLVLSALVALRQGSTRLPLRGPEGRATRLDLARRLLGDDRTILGLDPVRAVDIADALIDSGRAGSVVGAAEDFKPIIVDGDHLYFQKMLAPEKRFAENVLRRTAEDTPSWDDEEILFALHDVIERPAVCDGTPIPLSPHQAAAVRTAVRFSLGVISGGPGTGKTTIVVSILRTLRRLGIAFEDMILAAPTGKAAHRMEQAVRSGFAAIADPAPEDQESERLTAPQTLHRLLGYSPSLGRFLHHENNRLAGRVVVVDEASMIDLVLMERLVRSLRDDARLILLGDAHQLPSVEAGAVFRDLVADEGGGSPLGARPVRLTESYRMRPDDPDGRNILTVSRAIDRGESPAFGPERTGDGMIVERTSVAAVTFRGVEFLESDERSGVLTEFLDRWFAEITDAWPDFDELAGRAYVLRRDSSFSETDRDALGRLFEHFDRSRILCLTRSRPTGSDRVNRALHLRALDARAPGRDDDLIPGEPVMMQVNDYARMIFNGDQGIILRVSDGARPAPMVVFPRDGNFVAYRTESLRPVLLHSYAMTVHKAQGSEFDRVVLVLSDADGPINTREVLYTAMTRSRTAVTVLGSRAVFAQGIARRIHRASGLAAIVSEPRNPREMD